MADPSFPATFRKIVSQTAPGPQDIIRRVSLATSGQSRLRRVPEALVTNIDLQRWSDDGGHGRAPDQVVQPSSGDAQAPAGPVYRPAPPAVSLTDQDGPA